MLMLTITSPNSDAIEYGEESIAFQKGITYNRRTRRCETERRMRSAIRR